MHKKMEVIETFNRAQIEDLHALYQNEWWTKGRALSETESCVKGSQICLGLVDEEGVLQGFARVLTDFVTIAYLMDVFIIDNYRGKGLSKILLKKILEDKKFIRVKKWMLATLDAHGLYKKFGFKELSSPEKLMEKL